MNRRHIKISQIFFQTTVDQEMLVAIILGDFENITIWQRFNLAILLEESGWARYLFIWWRKILAIFLNSPNISSPIIDRFTVYLLQPTLDSHPSTHSRWDDTVYLLLPTLDSHPSTHSRWDEHGQIVCNNCPRNLMKNSFYYSTLYLFPLLPYCDMYIIPIQS